MGAAMVVGLTVLPASAGVLNGTTNNCSNGMKASVYGSQSNTNDTGTLTVEKLSKKLVGRETRFVSTLSGARPWTAYSPSLTAAHGYCEGIQ